MNRSRTIPRKFSLDSLSIISPMLGAVQWLMRRCHSEGGC
jgi:hypothetical protein